MLRRNSRACASPPGSALCSGALPPISNPDEGSPHRSDPVCCLRREFSGPLTPFTHRSWGSWRLGSSRVVLSACPGRSWQSCRPRGTSRRSRSVSCSSEACWAEQSAKLFGGRSSTSGVPTQSSGSSRFSVSPLLSWPASCREHGRQNPQVTPSRKRELWDKQVTAFAPATRLQTGIH